MAPRLPPNSSHSVLQRPRGAISRCSLLALRVLHVLLVAANALDNPLQAEIWLTVAQAHALRREGREAAAAADAARSRFTALGDAASVARCDLAAGVAAMAMGRYTKSATLLESARAACMLLCDRTGQAEAALQLAHYHAELTQFASALTLAQGAAALTPDDPWRVCRARIQIADAWFNQTRYPRCRGRLHRAGSALPGRTVGSWIMPICD